MLESSPVFTIITVIKNCPITDFNKTKRSILSQDFEDWQWIIKDCSDMYSRLSLPSNHKILYFNKPDKNIYDAMNQSVKQASGKYLLFLNAGDSIYENSTLMRISKRILNKDITFWYGDVMKPYSYRGKESYRGRLTKFYLFGRTICHQSWIIKTDILRKYPYGIDFPTGEDIVYQLKLLIELKVSRSYLELTVAEYQGGGISQRLNNIKNDQNRRFEELKRLIHPFQYYIYALIWKSIDRLKSLLKKILK
jgi:glycosyltransferase involved in cell wall biosynthesis